jgi:hypothetical protein
MAARATVRLSRPTSLLSKEEDDPMARTASATKKSSSPRSKTKSGTKTTARKTKARATGKRDVVDTPTGRFFAQRTKEGRFADLTKTGKSVARDRKTKAKTTVKSGYGHRGDQKR